MNVNCGVLVTVGPSVVMVVTVTTLDVIITIGWNLLKAALGVLG